MPASKHQTRASGASASCRRGGSESARRSVAPRRTWRSSLCVTTRPAGCRRRVVRSLYSMGVSRTSFPSTNTRRAARSTRRPGFEGLVALSRGALPRMAERDPDAGEQLGEAERLGQVVVRACVQRCRPSPARCGAESTIIGTASATPGAPRRRPGRSRSGRPRSRIRTSGTCSAAIRTPSSLADLDHRRQGPDVIRG